MNTGGEAAEQIVRMSLEGFEVAAKITGAGAKNIAVLLYSILKEEKKKKRSRLKSPTFQKGLAKSERRSDFARASPPVAILSEKNYRQYGQMNRKTNERS